MPLFKNEINYEGYFLFDKRIITDGRFACLHQAAKRIFPVIGIHCDKKTGIAFPSELTIAIKTGCTEKVVRAGVKSLSQCLDNFSSARWITKRGHSAKKYQIIPPAQMRRNAFPFHRCIMDGGNWRELTPTAQALYQTMRAYSQYNYGEFEEDEQALDADFDEAFKAAFKNRTFEICDADRHILAERAGISIKSIHAALISLKNNWLVERLDSREGRERWQINLIPPYRWKADYHNSKIQRSFKHLINR